ncbi:MAG TPA: 6-phosphogluconolactonase [Blastocatellia bacterium]|nr:6-phosphogluconolactonase [Blastocatellia bacterium]HAF21617.1 6-phosphogluconolactonase [Blastocatellia bacterium]
MESPSNVLIFDTPEQLALAAAEKFVEYAHDATGDRGLFTVALAGGNTPMRVYELLATDRFSNRIAWPQVHLFFGDERCVPPDHPESNYAMAYEMMISRVAIPAKNVHRIIGEGNPTDSARLYEEQLRTFFAGLAWPRFNLVWLGMGEDGHTASLFPNTESLKEESRWVLTTKRPQLEQDRVTLTAPVFNQAAHVVFLVTGKEKAARLAEVLHGPSLPDRLPAQLVRPVDGTLEWLCDREAAAKL